MPDANRPHSDYDINQQGSEGNREGESGNAPHYLNTRLPIPNTEQQPKIQNPKSKTATPTLRAFALAAVAEHVHNLQAQGNKSGEAQYLLAYSQVVTPPGSHWAARLPEVRQRPAPGDAALLDLARPLDLTDLELLTVALAAGAEEDAMIGRALAWLQSPVGGSRPTCGLVGAAFDDIALPGRPLDNLLTGNAVRSGLLTILSEGSPLPERALAVPLPLCLALAGCDGLWPGVTVGEENRNAALTLPAALEQEARTQADALQIGSCRTLTIRTGAPGEGRAVARAIARTLSCRTAAIEADSPPAASVPAEDAPTCSGFHF